MNVSEERLPECTILSPFVQLIVSRCLVWQQAFCLSVAARSSYKHFSLRHGLTGFTAENWSFKSFIRDFHPRSQSNRGYRMLFCPSWWSNTGFPGKPNSTQISKPSALLLLLLLFLLHRWAGEMKICYQIQAGGAPASWWVHPQPEAAVVALNPTDLCSRISLVFVCVLPPPPPSLSPPYGSLGLRCKCCEAAKMKIRTKRSPLPPFFSVCAAAGLPTRFLEKRNGGGGVSL